MRLMTEEEAKDLPALYQTEDTVANEKVLLMRFYELNTGWQWFLCEYSNEDKIAFGYVMGDENEWGYFSIDEMESIHSIQRDVDFKPMLFKNLKNR